MKKILSAAILMAAATTHAQQGINTAQDAVRFSTDNLTGTARFRAMGGAFGALGGDPSSIAINPAGSAIFMYNSGTLSLSSYNTNNQASFFGNRNKRNDNAFDLNQAGMVFVFNNNKEDATMNKFALGVNYENTQSFENIIGIRGVNPTGSIANYFLHYANGANGAPGVSLGNITSMPYENLTFAEQQASLGYEAYVINPLTDSNSNTEYIANNPGTNRYQDSYIGTSGFNGKVNLNFAAELLHRVYVGGNINVHFTDYINNTSFYEDSGNTSGTGFRDVEFNTERYTYGGGVSFDVGTIVKVSDKLRLGAAYQSPTWMRLQDEITQNINYVNDGQFGYYNPQVTMVGDDYTIKTPSKWTLSAATIFGKKGLLSIDYAIRDYSNTKYTGGRFDAINQELSQTLDWAGELRVGTEWRVKKLSLRGGYRYSESPYKNGRTMGPLTSYSAGLGYSFGGSRLDLAYAWYQRKSDVSTFTPGLTDAARVKTTGNNVTLSYTIDL